MLCPDSASGPRLRLMSPHLAHSLGAAGHLPLPLPTPAWPCPPQCPPSSAPRTCPLVSGSPGRGHGWSRVGGSLLPAGFPP